MIQRRATLNEIVEASGLSRATVDRVINNRPGVHPRTRDLVARVVAELEKTAANANVPNAAAPLASKYFQLCIQGSEAFADALEVALANSVEAFRARGCKLGLMRFAANEDEKLSDHLATSGEKCDGVAIAGRNAETVGNRLRALKQRQIPIVSFTTDVDADARHRYVGIDNRAAGQTAAFLLGSHLKHLPAANVALVVNSASCRSHEDREIGCRALLRQRYPQINLFEIVKGEDDVESTYQSLRDTLSNGPDISALYDLSGDNRSLAKAIQDCGRSNLLYIAHELNPVSSTLLKENVIDYLIAQHLPTLLSAVVDALLQISAGKQLADIHPVPIQLLCRYSI
ncbi:MAG: LacI family DNA-binding transcriptional regulator [Oxalobacteraceae bacterium]